MIEKKIQIPNWMLDEHWKLRITAFMEMAQHYGELDCDTEGLGYDVLRDQNNDAWIFIRAKITINGRPSYLDEVTFKSYHEGLEGPVCIRRHELIDKNGNTLIEADYSCCIINLESRKVQRPSKYYIPEIPCPAENIAPKISIPVLAVQIGSTTHKVGYSDVDYNHHVNNVSYVRWVFDAMGAAAYEKEVKYMEVNYMHEIEKDATVEIRTYRCEDTYYVKVMSSQERIAFIAKVE